jgi:hypothetical protein
MNSRRISKTKSIETDIVVIGGGGCGMAAAVAAAAIKEALRRRFRFSFHIILFFPVRRQYIVSFFWIIGISGRYVSRPIRHRIGV